MLHFQRYFRFLVSCVTFEPFDYLLIDLFVGTLICIPLLKYWGRKKTLIMANCLTGGAMLTIAFMDSKKSGFEVFLPNIAITGM